MMAALDEYTLGIKASFITPAAPNFRSPSWPPPRDWPVVVDKNGAIVSRWADSIWDLGPWAGKRPYSTLGDSDSDRGRAEPLDSENAFVLRMVATWLIWGPSAAGSVNTVVVNSLTSEKIVALCSRNGISAARLMRFPSVLERLPEVISVGKYSEIVALLHRLNDAQGMLGFSIVDSNGLKRLFEFTPNHDAVQTPYIPPRIWLYQIQRLRECVDDFLAHQSKIDACFHFCIKAYASNFGIVGISIIA